MSEMQTLAPAYGTGVTAITGAASVAQSVTPGSKSLCLSNLGTVVVYIRTGDVNAVATIADYPILAGQQVTITRFADYTHVAHISPAGAGSLHIMGGEGL